MHKLTFSCICVNIRVCVYVCVYARICAYTCVTVLTVQCSAGVGKKRTCCTFLYCHPASACCQIYCSVWCVVCGACLCVCVGVCLVLPEGCSGDVMNHLNEGQGVRCGSTAVTHTLQRQIHPQIYFSKSCS